MKQLSQLHIPDEHIICVEIFSTSIRVASVSVFKESMRLNAVEEELFSFVQPEAIQSLVKRVLKNSTTKAKPKFIISVSSLHGTTIHAGTGVVRQKHELAISENELEHIVAKALWKIFLASRAKAAKQLGLSEREVALADVDVMGITLDGNKVVSPVGFVARAAEVWCEETIVNKKKLKKIFQQISPEDVVSVGELSGRLTRLVEPNQKEQQYLFVYIGGSKTMLYPVRDGRVLPRDVIEWGSNSFLHIIMRSLCVEESVAQEIIQRYRLGKLSKSFEKEIDSLFAGEAALLLHGIELWCQREKFEAAYIYTHAELPMKLSSSGLRRKLQLSFSLKSVSAQSISEKYGFNLQLNEREIQSGKKYDTLFLNILAAYSRYAGVGLEKISGHRDKWLQG